MRAEMLEEYDKANDILDSILEEDESNNQAKKRKIALGRVRFQNMYLKTTIDDRFFNQKAKSGENSRSIAELVKYLRDFMNDAEAWMELCELYILEQVLAFFLLLEI